jgi:hypothetical protein
MRNTLNCKMEWTRTVANVHTNCKTIPSQPNDVDTGMTISRLENIKAIGHDQIPAKLNKEGGK